MPSLGGYHSSHLTRLLLSSVYSSLFTVLLDTVSPTSDLLVAT